MDVKQIIRLVIKSYEVYYIEVVFYTRWSVWSLDWAGVYVPT